MLQYLFSKAASVEDGSMNRKANTITSLHPSWQFFTIGFLAFALVGSLQAQVLVRIVQG